MPFLEVVQLVTDEDSQEYFTRRVEELTQITRLVGCQPFHARDLSSAEPSIKAVLNGRCAAAIVMNVHGDPGTGNFANFKSGTRETVTPDILWNGYPPASIPAGAINPWRGLGAILNESSQDGAINNGYPVYIVAAQCFGIQFTDSIRSFAKGVPSHVIFHGLSYGNTHSVRLMRNTLEEAKHLELQQFIQTIHARESLGF